MNIGSFSLLFDALFLKPRRRVPDNGKRMSGIPRHLDKSSKLKNSNKFEGTSRNLNKVKFVAILESQIFQIFPEKPNKFQKIAKNFKALKKT